MLRSDAASFAAPASITLNSVTNFSLGRCQAWAHLLRINKPLGLAHGMSRQLPRYAGACISDPILTALCQAWAYILQSNSIDATHGLTLARKPTPKIVAPRKSAPTLQLIIRCQAWAHALLAAITWHEITLTTICRSTTTTDALPSLVLHSSKIDSTPSLVLRLPKIKVAATRRIPSST